MKKLAFGLFFLMASLVGLTQSPSTTAQTIYEDLRSDFPKPSFEVFELGYRGYSNLYDQGKLGNKEILTVIDFSLSSNEKRMWIIDLKTKTIVDNVLVAHGKKTGEEYAKNFSNVPQSYKSSLGFYVTGKTYIGKHGLSLFLDGAEKGYNNNARARAIVMHGAKYVSQDFINKYGRLGRSFGCPSVSIVKHKEVIRLLANKTCLFIYFPDEAYLNGSKLLAKND